MPSKSKSPGTGRLLSLHAAAEEGDISAVIRRIQRGQRTDVRKNGRLPIELAAAHGHKEICFALLDSLESQDRNDFAAVGARFAAVRGRAETCGALLDSIPDNDERLSATKDALAAAVREQQVATLVVLLDRLHDEERKRIANTLLPFAARFGCADVCAVLLERAPDDTVERKRTIATALIAAVTQGRVEATAMLLAHVPAGAWRTRLVNDALFWAADSGRREISVFLLEAGADMDAPRHDGESPRSLVADSPQLRAVFEGHVLRSRQNARTAYRRIAM